MSVRALKAEASRARILESATRLFQERGYHGVGVAEICLAAGAPKGLVYHHFPGGKAAIATAALDSVAQATRARIAALRAEGLSGPAIVAALTDAVADWGAALDWRQGSIFAAFGVDLSGEAEPLRQCLAGHLESLIGDLAQGWSRQAAWVALAALEGALTASRALRYPAPLQALGAHLRLDDPGGAP